MRKLFIICSALAIQVFSNSTQAAESKEAHSKMVYIHHGPETDGDGRYDYHWRVLKKALEATEGKYGPFEMKSIPGLTESRQELELTKEKDNLINTMLLDLGSVNQTKIIPVTIPVDKGLLGYRVFLIRAEDQVKLDQVKTLIELKNKFKIGQGSQWVDFSIYERNGFSVTGSPSYEQLFGMLAKKRFDLFGRGITEVQGELQAHKKQFPELAIEQNFLIYYPLPMYFLFKNSDEGRSLAKRVQEGMETISANRQLDSLFNAQFGGLIKDLKLSKRKLFVLENPYLKHHPSLDDKKLWYKVNVY